MASVLFKTAAFNHSATSPYLILQEIPSADYLQILVLVTYTKSRCH